MLFIICNRVFSRSLNIAMRATTIIEQCLKRRGDRDKNKCNFFIFLQLKKQSTTLTNNNFTCIRNENICEKKKILSLLDLKLKINFM